MSISGGSVLNVLSFYHLHCNHLGSLLNMLITDPHPRLPIIESVVGGEEEGVQKSVCSISTPVISDAHSSEL